MLVKCDSCGIEFISFDVKDGKNLSITIVDVGGTAAKKREYRAALCSICSDSLFDEIDAAYEYHTEFKDYKENKSDVIDANFEVRK